MSICFLQQSLGSLKRDTLIRFLLPIMFRALLVTEHLKFAEKRLVVTNLFVFMNDDLFRCQFK